MPTADSTHEAAQRIVPESRVVHVDNDPIVLARAAAPLTGTPEGRTSYLDEDLRDTGTILARAGQLLGFDRPVALILLGVVVLIEDDAEAHRIVRRRMRALPTGSHLVLWHTVTRPDMPDVDAAVASWKEHGTPKPTQRSPEAVAGFFDGLQLL